VSNRLSRDNVETLTLNYRGPIFYELATIQRRKAACKAQLDSNNGENGAMIDSPHSLTRNRRTVVRATPPLAFKKDGRTCLLSPWERFERLVVCLNFGGMQTTRR